jgi:hypothetical protein
VEATPATTGKSPQASQSAEPHRKYINVIIGTHRWTELPSYLKEGWAVLPFTSEEEASMEGLNQDFPTKAQLKQTRFLMGLRQRMARLDTQVEFPILVEYMMDKIPEGRRPGDI